MDANKEAAILDNLFFCDKIGESSIDGFGGHTDAVKVGDGVTLSIAEQAEDSLARIRCKRVGR